MGKVFNPLGLFYKVLYTLELWSDLLRWFSTAGVLLRRY
jgi:hypothetical protein